MAKTIYEGYRVGKDGGERWTGTTSDRKPKSGTSIAREVVSGRFTETRTPRGGSAISSPNHSDPKK